MDAAAPIVAPRPLRSLPPLYLQARLALARLAALAPPNTSAGLFALLCAARSLCGGLLPALAVCLCTTLAYVATLREDCSICCETRNSVLEVVDTGCEAAHSCCVPCLRRWLATDEGQRVGRLRRARRFNLTCPLGCQSSLSREVAYFAAGPPLRAVISDLERRGELIGRCPASSTWVECREMACVGVAYTGGPSLMCFICTRQWRDPDYGLARRLWRWVSKKLWRVRIDGISGWRPCPHCGAAIVKDGGCLNMRCSMCDGVFLWSQSGNTVEGCVEEHAPPSTRTSSR